MSEGSSQFTLMLGPNSLIPGHKIPRSASQWYIGLVQVEKHRQENYFNRGNHDPH